MFKEKSKNIKFGFIFLIVMLFFTLFSRSIMNFLTPKVSIAMSSTQMITDKISLVPEIITQDGINILSTNVSQEDASYLQIGHYCEFNIETDGQMRYMTGRVEQIGSEAADGMVSITIRPDMELPDDSTPIGLSITLFGNYYNLVVPVSAMISANQLYVIEKKDGFLGEEIYIHKRDVNVDFISEGNVILIDGISMGEFVVTGWDRPLKDGQRVMLLYQ